MNEITAAIREVIKKKAEEKYKMPTEFEGNFYGKKTHARTSRKAYTCGGEDAMKFLIWKDENYERFHEQNGDVVYVKINDVWGNRKTLTELFEIFNTNI